MPAEQYQERSQKQPPSKSVPRSIFRPNYNLGNNSHRPDKKDSCNSGRFPIPNGASVLFNQTFCGPEEIPRPDKFVFCSEVSLMGIFSFNKEKMKKQQ